jgi:hypothetical protein
MLPVSPSFVMSLVLHFAFYYVIWAIIASFLYVSGSAECEHVPQER